VLGAGVKSITFNIIKNYLVLLIIALAIGAPLGHYGGAMVIDMAYAYHMPFDATGAVMAVMLIVSVLLTMVITQVRRIFGSNPVQGLKVE
jgi:hypothetical protein